MHLSNMIYRQRFVSQLSCLIYSSFYSDQEKLLSQLELGRAHLVECCYQLGHPQNPSSKAGYTVMLWTSVLIHVALARAVAGQGAIFDQIQKLYLQQGIPFRENIYLDNLPILPEYDFVVVGSGPAGSAIASRLSEQPDWTVLLIEKGHEGNIYNDIPFINVYTVLGNLSKVYTVEEEAGVCTGLEGGTCHWPSGNGLGGGSLINALLWTRGFPSDYDRWANDGNPGWSYDQVLPYFRKSEHMTVRPLENSKYHSKSGPVNIEYPFQTDIAKIFLKGVEELGYDLIDYNNPNTMIGFSRTQISTKDGIRHSAANAYLLPVRDRKNLHVITGSLAMKVLIDRRTKRTLGVKFMKKEQERVVLARKEVILSAGGFGSPQLLMLSGIGPRDHLEELNIPVIQDLPVGDNLQEHLGTPLSFMINSTDSITLPKLLISMPKYLLQWMTGNGGLLSNNGGEILGFVKTPLGKENKPNIEIIFLPLQLGADGGVIRKTAFVRDEVYEKTWGGVTFREGFMLLPMLLHPGSRGTVRLRSTDPRDDPTIDGNFLSDPNDIRGIIEGVRAILHVVDSPALRRIGTRLHDIPVAGCEGHVFNSDEYWECAVRRVPIQFHHQCGTCRMGPNPESAVVDPRLRVHGVQGLRVADASIMPYIPALHTMAPCYMIGEKAADLIKEDWNAVGR